MLPQYDIIKELRVNPNIHMYDETRARVNFLKKAAADAGASGFVLGISGGWDSALAGHFAKLAAEEDNLELLLINLPYGEQADADDAAYVLNTFLASPAATTMTVNIKPSVDALAAAVPGITPFTKGNTKARARMTIQYAFAGDRNLLVLGADNAAETLLGFSTKHGDGASDVSPLYGLMKYQVGELLAYAGASDQLLQKTPTADLLDDAPLQADETEIGLPYATIDAFLTGEAIEYADEEHLIRQWQKTAHKRNGSTHYGASTVTSM